MESFYRFSRLTIGITVALTAAGAGAIALYDSAAAKGFLIGGLAGAAGFWHMGTRVRKFATISPVELPYRILRWTFVRMGIYAVALVGAYTIDYREYHGLVAAVFGLLVSHLVLIALGFTIIRTRSDKNVNSV